MAPVSNRVAVRRHHAEGDALVGPDQAVALVELARADHDLALDVEEEGGARARNASEQVFENSAVGHRSTSAAS